MPSKIKTTTIKDGARIRVKEYKHQFAIFVIQQAMRNLELEIAQKKRSVHELEGDQSLPQEPAKFMRQKITVMGIEYRRMAKSVLLLEKHNKPVKVNMHDKARLKEFERGLL